MKEMNNSQLSTALQILTVALLGFIAYKLTFSGTGEQMIVQTAAFSDDGAISEISEEELQMEAELDREEEKFEAEMTELDRQELIEALKVAMRKYGRQKELMAWNETRYLERLKVYHASFLILEARGTPGIFAGELPEKDVYGFMEFLDVSEELDEILDMLLDGGYDNTSEADLPQWVALHEEVNRNFDLPFPSTGLAIEDANIAIQSARYQEVGSKTIALTVRFVKARADETLEEIFALIQGNSPIVREVQNMVGPILKQLGL